MCYVSLSVCFTLRVLRHTVLCFHILPVCYVTLSVCYATLSMCYATQSVCYVTLSMCYASHPVRVLRHAACLFQPMPGEVARYVYSDEEMRNVHLRLRRSYEYCEVSVTPSFTCSAHTHKKGNLK